MKGPLIDAVAIAVVVAIILLATAHWWGPILGLTARRMGRNLDIAGEAIFRFARRIVGQGQARPQKESPRLGSGEGGRR